MSTWRRREVSRPRSHEAGTPQDQWNVQRRLVGEEAMSDFSVVAEGLAVVRSQDEQDRRGRRAGVLEEGSERLVHARHFARVGIGRVTRGEVLRRDMRRMAIVEVHPEKSRAPRLVRPPAAREATTSDAGRSATRKSYSLAPCGYRSS